MANYLLIETNDPFESRTVEEHVTLAADLARAGNDVSVFLVQNGVLPTRPGPRSGVLAPAVEAGVKLFADDFSLRERAIPADGLAEGIEVASIDLVVDCLEAGAKTIWL